MPIAEEDRERVHKLQKAQPQGMGFSVHTPLQMFSPPFFLSVSVSSPHPPVLVLESEDRDWRVLELEFYADSKCRQRLPSGGTEGGGESVLASSFTPLVVGAAGVKGGEGPGAVTVWKSHTKSMSF